MTPEAYGRFFGEDVMKTVANRIEFHLPQRVVLSLTQSVEVHIKLILGQGRGHQLLITTQNVPAHGLNAHAIFLLSVGHSHPIVAFGSHHIERLANHRYGHHRHQYGDEGVARHDFL